MDKTPFADLTRLTAGDPLSLDGASFLWRNPTITDRLLRIGARTHRHDNHAALANPAGEPVVVADATQGSIPADTTVTVAYTLVDDDGGETLPSPITAAATPAAMEPPALTPDVSVVYDAGGGITIGSYFYAVTLVDDSGGETTVGAAVQADREPGGATAKIVISGLAAIVADTPGATGWRLYRATGGGSFRFLEDGASDEVVDDGTLCADCDTTPPTANTTNRTNAIRVTIPDTLDVQDAAGIRIYMSTTGDFVSPALAEVLPVDQAGVELAYTSITLEEGSPPDVSTSVGGAQQIDADTELANFFWRTPVADAAALAALVPDENQVGDVRMTLSDRRLFVWDGDSWESAGGGGHVIQDEGVALPQRAALSVVGEGVTATDDAANDRTVITITAGTAWMGAWNPATAYVVDDEVERSGSSYIAVAATTGDDPATDPGTSWQLRAAKGGPGPQGDVGPAGAGGVWRGPWNVATAYVVDDVVSRSGSSYIAVAPSTGDDPATQPTWELVAAKGDSGAGGGLPSRGDVAGTAVGLAAGAGADLALEFGKAWTAFRIQTNRPARVRVYPTAAHRAADEGRAIGTDPVGDHGVLLDYVTTGADLDAALAPPVGGYNLDGPVTADAYVRVTNLDAAAGDTTVTITCLSQEA